MAPPRLSLAPPPGSRSSNPGKEGFKSWIKTGTARSAWRSTWPFLKRIPPAAAILKYEFRKYDRNGDGFITREEFFAPVSLRDEFRALDKNQDGRVSRGEFLQEDKIFRNLDRNHDGFITLEEYLYGYRNRSPQR
ncbi:MAG: EF-hand domain-containing protein [Deltaproteobacteria bacterium]|nr:EF-hand domain-containing protein [Deltaproteobacteria bacterium]